MLIPRPTLEGIAAGTVTLAFRRWDRPRVRPGTRLRTAVGVVEIVSIAPVPVDRISRRDAALAGAASRDELVGYLAGRRAGQVYRIEVRYAGADPRVALRDRDQLGEAELAELRARLARLDRAQPWTAMVLRLIQANPEVRAVELAERIGWDKPRFKRQVRQLKELGLTESLEKGYRLSPRGQAVLSSMA